jgi:UDP-glucose 4-epimerase
MTEVVDQSSQPIPDKNKDGVVLVTGICGRLGQLLARQLHRVDRVVGVDSRLFEGKPEDVAHYQLDLRQKKLREVFNAHPIRAVVHLGVAHDPRIKDSERYSWNVAGFQNLIEQLVQYQIPKLILLSSATIYGPRPENPYFLTEEAPLLGAEKFSRIRDLVQVDMLAQSLFWKTPQVETVILRPCYVLGKVRNAPSNYLRQEHPLIVLGFDPTVQFIHERDLVHAVSLALTKGVRGVFNLRGAGELPLSNALRILNKTPALLPGFLAEGLVRGFWSSRAGSYHPAEIEYLRYICTVDDTRARAQLGYKPSYRIEDTLKAVFTEF